VWGRDAYDNVIGPVESEVTTSKAKVFLPQAMRNYPEIIPPPPAENLYEDFVGGIPDEWTPFLNWPDLAANQWYWTGDGETWGRLNYSPGKEPLSRWALNMYQGEGAEEWANYRVEAKVRADKRYEHPLICLWFRGTYEERADLQGGDVTGYILCLRTDEDMLYLGYVDPTKRILDFRGQQWVDAERFDNFTNIWYTLFAEVRGSTIRAGVEMGPILGWTDTAGWLNGTVGFAVYRGYGSLDYMRVTPLED
jgi:hypothetical protein